MPTAARYHQYEILRREDGSLWELGRGAMGITYKAYDTNLRFTVALKVINSAYLENDTARQRFLREARAAAALRHSNVASVFNLGIEQDKYFYVMEFVDGETLEARVKRKGSLEPVEALNIALQVARALAVAAKQQLVHRDLKPTNLMLVDQEGESIVKVIDFGLAKVAKDAGEDSGTLTMGGFVGTPHFASPEQVEEGEVDIRSDIYSLGATLYFVLTGQSPFSGSVGQVMSQHLYKPLPMERLTSLPRCVVSLLQRMMEKDRNNRPQTPQELQKAILACLEEIRPSSGRSVPKTGETISAFETLDLSSRLWTALHRWCGACAKLQTHRRTWRIATRAEVSSGRPSAEAPSQPAGSKSTIFVRRHSSRKSGGSGATVAKCAAPDAARDLFVGNRP